MTEEEKLLNEVVVELINYYERAYGKVYSVEDFYTKHDNLGWVGIAYTIPYDYKFEIEVFLDLINYKLIKYVNGVKIDTVQYVEENGQHPLEQLREDIKSWTFKQLVKIDNDKFNENINYIIIDDYSIY